MYVYHKNSEQISQNCRVLYPQIAEQDQNSIVHGEKLRRKRCKGDFNRSSMEPKTHKVQEICEKIIAAKKKNNWEEINAQLLKKRLQWLEVNKKVLDPQGTEVRKAYTLFLIQYLKPDPAEVPIIFENETKIIW